MENYGTGKTLSICVQNERNYKWYIALKCLHVGQP